MTEVLDLADPQLAILTVLGLRGAQTAGELRQRCERLHEFTDVDRVDAALAELAARPTPFVRNVGREPGQSQDRWEHLLGAQALSATESRQHAMYVLFEEMHQSGFFVLPNPWDRGSARMLQELGAQALATTSAGFGRVIGKDDQQVSREELVAHVADLAAFVEVPLNVDSEHLFPDAPGGIAESVRLLAEAGAAGVSIEDFDPKSGRIISIDESVAAVRDAAEACAHNRVVLTARAENHLYGHGDLDDTVTRLQAYREAGADCLYAPGLTELADIELVLAETDAPLNVLAMPAGPSLTELESVGVRRVSTGSALYNAGARAARDAAAAFFNGE